MKISTKQKVFIVVASAFICMDVLVRLKFGWGTQFFVGFLGGWFGSDLIRYFSKDKRLERLLKNYGRYCNFIVATKRFKFIRGFKDKTKAEEFSKTHKGSVIVWTTEGRV